MLVFGYCAMGRTLSLLPWNRTEPFSLNLLRRTFFSLPVVVRPELVSACGGENGVCELESRVAYLQFKRDQANLELNNQPNCTC